VAGSVSILLGNGDGTLQAPKTMALGQNAAFMAVADFNVDKKSDLAVGDLASLSIFLGNGDGTFQTAKKTALASNCAGFITADFNGDLKPDVALVTAAGIQILLGKGDGTFSQGATVTVTVTGVSPPNPVIYDAVITADLNHDGKEDLLVSTQVIEGCGPKEPPCSVTFTNITAFLGNGDGSFQGEQIAASESLSVRAGDVPRGYEIDLPFVGDFNGDGKLDLAYRKSQGVRTLAPFLEFRLGKGDGTFSLPVLRVGDSLVVKPVAQDLNGDKLTDLIAVGTANDIDVRLNTSPASGADLAVVGSGASPNPVGVGTSLTFTGDVLNLGPQDATGVTFTETLPNSVNFVSATATQGSCVQSHGIVSCSVGSLGSVFDSKVSIVVTPTAVGVITNSMSVAANEPDPVPANNNATETVSVVPIFVLTVTKTGNGTGTVTAGAAINCGNTCSANYLQGTSVSLTATPAGTSVFAAWSGACTGTDPNACGVTMNSAQSVTASFIQAPDFTLAAASTTFNLQTGAHVTDVLTLAEQNGFSGQVNLNCTVNGSAPLATCSVSPSSVTLGSTPSNSTLTITAPTTLTASALPLNEGSRNIAYAVILPFPALLLGGIGLASWRFRKRRSGLWYLGGSVVVVFAVLAGCGGGGIPAQTPKNYMVTVNAMSASGSVQHSTTVTITVQ
jgi:uncharacterized repeat protein (TIGR01451 family)